MESASEEQLVTPPVPQPGPARPWEADVAISTYSRVNTHHGNLFTAIPIVSWSGLGPDMSMMLYHNSASVNLGYSIADVVGFDLGPDWSFSYSDHIRLDVYPNPTEATVVAADGTRNVFEKNTYGNWESPFGVFDELTFNASTLIWRLKHKDQSFHQFMQGSDGIARLARVEDAVGNASAIVYAGGGAQPLFTSITDAAGRGLTFTDIDDDLSPEYGIRIVDSADGDAGWHDRVYRLRRHSSTGTFDRIEDAMGYDRPTGVGYFSKFAFDAAGRIVGITDKCDGCNVEMTAIPHLNYIYAYTTDGRLSQVIDPDTYDTNDGYTQQFALTCSLSMNYGSTTGTYTDRRGYLTRYTYAQGGQVAIPNNMGTLTEVAGPVTTVHPYFVGGLLRYLTDGDGNQWAYTYDARGNMLTATDPLDHTRTWTYDSFNNVTSTTDAGGNIVRYYYDEYHPRFQGKCEVTV